MQTFGSQCADQNAAKIAAMRCGSRAALESETFELAALRFHANLDLKLDPALEAKAWEPSHTDWLGQAKSDILAEGSDPGPDAKRLATSYGWTSIEL